MTDRISFFKKYRAYLALAVLVLLAYTGVPAPMLKSPVHDHLAGRYGIHVDVESVRVSVRGLIVSDAAAVWPHLNATLSIKELTLGWSPLKSIVRGRFVFDRLKIVYPAVTCVLADPLRMPRPPAGAQPVESEAIRNGPPRLPEVFDITVRRGRIHLMRGQSEAVIFPFDAEVERTARGAIDGWVSIESPQMGTVDVRYVEGSSLKVTLGSLNLAILSDLIGSPQHVGGLLSASIERKENQVEGRARIESLVWSGTVEADSPAETAADTAVIEAADTVVADTAAFVATDPETPAPAPDTAAPAAAPRISFIPIPLDVALDLGSALWDSQTLGLENAVLSVTGADVRLSGSVGMNRKLDAELDFYAPSFDEPALETISSHFHVLRYLHAFLETIRSPSELQAKMHMRGSLTQPKSWRYEGLVDIRRDTFSYGPFGGQYSFMGTVQFNQHGVTIPEIQIPFGEAYLSLSGTAADYATHHSRMELRGADLDIGPVLDYYAPHALQPADTASSPSGRADARLILSKDGESPWSLDGKVEFRRVSIPMRAFSASVRAFGDMTFAGRRASGALRVRTGTFETEIRPYVEDLFSESVTAGVIWKEPQMRWERLARAMAAERPVPYLPSAGTGEVSANFQFGFGEEADTSDAGPAAWKVDGAANLRDGRFRLPPFGAPVDSASADILFEGDRLRLQRASGTLGKTRLIATGASRPGRIREWTLDFQSPALDLAELLSMIERPEARAEPPLFAVDVTADVGKLRFKGFEIEGVSGQFSILPGQFGLTIDTPIRTSYASQHGQNPWSELTFIVDQPFPIRKLFAPSMAISGDVSGTVVLKGPNLSDTSRLSGLMDLSLNQFTLKRAPALLKILELTRFSFMDALVFDPFVFRSPIEAGAVAFNLDQKSNTGRWVMRGRLGLDASYQPLRETDSGFHVTYYPRENILVRILSESKLLDLLGGKGEGIKLDFVLIGNYNNANILWTDAPLISVIRGRVSELVPGLFNAPTPTDSP